MTQALVIRAVVNDDFAAWKPLWDGYNRFYGRHDETALPEHITRATWSRFLDSGEPVHALIAEADGRMLGLAHFLFHRSTIQIELNCYLQDLFTVEAARGQGVGRALIEAVFARAAQLGLPRVYWQTHQSNTGAMRLYDKLADKSGFIVYRSILPPANAT
jgi:GNAT superfamily N-acetyltransferase